MSEGLILDLDETPEDEYKYHPVNCSRTITANDESITVSITCLKWTLNYDYCVRVTAHPQRAPNVSKQLNLDDCHTLFRSLTDALHLYETLNFFLNPI